MQSEVFWLATPSTSHILKLRLVPFPVDSPPVSSLGDQLGELHSSPQGQTGAFHQSGVPMKASWMDGDPSRDTMAGWTQAEPIAG